MNPKHAWSHYIGLSASFLCLIHCLALPLITPLLPLLAAHNHWLVESLFVVLISLSTLTLFKGYREHGEKRSLLLGALGFSVLFVSLFLEHNSVQIYLSVLGSVLMTTAHYTNYRLCQFQAACCEHHS